MNLDFRLQLALLLSNLLKARSNILEVGDVSHKLNLAAAYLLKLVVAERCYIA